MTLDLKKIVSKLEIQAVKMPQFAVFYQYEINLLKAGIIQPVQKSKTH